MMSMKTFCFAYQMLPMLHLSAIQLVKLQPSLSLLYSRGATSGHTSGSLRDVVYLHFRIGMVLSD